MAQIRLMLTAASMKNVETTEWSKEQYSAMIQYLSWIAQGLEHQSLELETLVQTTIQDRIFFFFKFTQWSFRKGVQSRGEEKTVMVLFRSLKWGNCLCDNMSIVENHVTGDEN